MKRGKRGAPKFRSFLLPYHANFTISVPPLPSATAPKSLCKDMYCRKRARTTRLQIFHSLRSEIYRKLRISSVRASLIPPHVQHQESVPEYVAVHAREDHQTSNFSSLPSFRCEFHGKLDKVKLFEPENGAKHHLPSDAI